MVELEISHLSFIATSNLLFSPKENLGEDSFPSQCYLQIIVTPAATSSTFFLLF
jgi:hypothetical protein